MSTKRIARRVSLTRYLSAGILLAGCAAPKSSPMPQTSISDAPTLERVTPDRVQSCTGFPSGWVRMIDQPGSPSEAANAAATLSFAPRKTPGLKLITVILYRGRSTFGSDFPSAGRKPGGEKVLLASGRQAIVDGQGFFLGGAVVWGTVTSPHGEYDVTVVIDEVMHDMGIEPEDLKALRLLEPAKLVDCIDVVVW